MKVLITGVNGFVGPHLAEHIISHHPEARVWGQAWGNLGREQLRPLVPDLTVLEGDLTDSTSLAAIFETVQPDVLFHLAAASSVSSSWSNPARIFHVNVVGQINLFEAMAARDLAPVTVVASSAEIYGRGPGGDGPLSEHTPVQPISPYGSSKAAQDILAYQYYAAQGLPTVRLRLFNHTGPRQQVLFVASDFAHQIAEIEAGRRAPLMEVGNLDACRDFTDVRDVVRAYWLAAAAGEAGAAYNICSGRAVSIQSLLDTLLELSETTVEVRSDPARLRAADLSVLVGDHSRFTAATGWVAEIPLRQTLADLLDWWRERV